MTAWRRVAGCAVVAVLAALGAEGGLEGQGVSPVVDVVARAVSPSSIEVGAEALERLVVTAPEGVAVSVRDVGPPDVGRAERMGAWRSSKLKKAG